MRMRAICVRVQLRRVTVGQPTGCGPRWREYQSYSEDAGVAMTSQTNFPFFNRTVLVVIHG